MVIGLHTIQQVAIHHSIAALWNVLFYGSLGVSLSICGYLITPPSLHKAAIPGQTGHCGLCLKRAFRIMRPLYVCGLVGGLLAAAGGLTLRRSDILSALLFFPSNALHSNFWALRPLSVETPSPILGMTVFRGGCFFNPFRQTPEALVLLGV